MNLFDSALQSSSHVAPLDILLRLTVALLLGMVVAWVYHSTARSRESGSSFRITLILLSVLIAMVTQVIGNNVALAFSLVGALSVVRFRTVVRDTRDTAYVIFAVVVGMAVGAANLWVAVLGIAVIGLASALMLRMGLMAETGNEHALILRCVAGRDPRQIAASVFTRHLNRFQLLGIATSKQGLGFDYRFTIILREGLDLHGFVTELALVEGIQDIRIEPTDRD